jgi:polysaccharide pyruvyl transferase WcaK-like protein
MRVELINSYSTRNLGDAAIYAVLDELIRSHGGERVSGANAAPESFISVGGDIFNNAREWLVTRNFAGNLLRLARLPRGRAMLFGQSIPSSCHGPAFQLLAATLRRLGAVSVRDAYSHARLVAAKVPARLGYDTVFAAQPKADWPVLGRQLLETAGVDGDRCALITLRSFGTMYRHDTKSFLDRLGQLCHRLRQRGHQPAILLQSDVDGDDSDRVPAAYLRSVVPGLPLIDPFSAADGRAWEAAAGAAAIARTVVAVRYHGAIFRMIGGRVPFNLYYSNKGRDLVERLRQPGVSVADFDPAAVVAGIERSADQTTDAGHWRRLASADFSECWADVGGGSTLKRVLELKNGY